jgi:hypothetical protein
VTDAADRKGRDYRAVGEAYAAKSAGKIVAR